MPKMRQGSHRKPRVLPRLWCQTRQGDVAEHRCGNSDIIDGCSSVLVVLGLIVAIVYVSDEPGTLAILVPIAVLFAVKAILAIVGGICALQKKNWGMAIIGAIAASLPFSLLGIAALILTAISRDQFSQRTAST